jgi:hypothetical protein
MMHFMDRWSSSYARFAFRFLYLPYLSLFFVGQLLMPLP